MASINVDKDTKAEFDELQPDDLTQAEFAQELIEAYRRDNGEIVNTDKIADEIVEQVTHRTASEIELAAYRGLSEAQDE